jgi:alkanesulfonate monooxygenase SsuD/methylene tetrahydromethanopterin reductase-like flavin-dependent oxidoreductase (luciferase family)
MRLKTRRRVLLREVRAQRAATHDPRREEESCMKAYHFTEAPYPIDESTFDELDSLRVSFPSQLIDPKRAADLWNMYLDQWQYADEIGMNVMVNEHHATATCMNTTSPLIASILARITNNAEILMLGNPVANRADPVRVAEEMVTIDLISRGRLKAGMVRGVAFEIPATNSEPILARERFWEAVDLIIKAWTTHDGPFSWQGKHFEHRQVNLVPRPFQEPHPPIAVPVITPSSVRAVAERNFTCGTVLQNVKNTRRLFDEYRTVRRECGDHSACTDRLNSCSLIYVGDTDEEGLAGAARVVRYLTHNKAALPFWGAPGFVPPEARSRVLKGGRPFHFEGADGNLEHLIEEGVLFAGNPDTVYQQMERFVRAVGGYEEQVLMMHGWDMTQDDTLKSMRLFATEVYPRLQALDVSSFVDELEPVAG